MSKPRQRVPARRFVDVPPPTTIGSLVPLPRREAPPAPPAAFAPSSTLLVVHFRDGTIHRVEAVTEIAWTKGALVIDADQGRLMYPVGSISHVYEPHPRASLAEITGQAA